MGWAAVLIAALAGSLLIATPAHAHAHLLIAVPAANAVLRLPPDEIRLWFSEPLEPPFSRITLRGTTGAALDLPPAQVDALDPMQLVVSLREKPGRLPDGVYTVSWQVVSAADGHASGGSFAFTVGTVSRTGSTSEAASEDIPGASAGVRAFNLLSLALLVGGIGFWLFAWQPAQPAQPLPLPPEPGSAAGAPDPAPAHHQRIERRMRWLIVLAWGLVGVSSAGLLLNQAATTADTSLIGAVGSPTLTALLERSRFGAIWWGRVACWLAVGVALFWPGAADTPRRDQRRLDLWLVLAFGSALLLTNSLISHANAAPDSAAATVSDWVHLWLTSLWIGGLAQFLNALTTRANASATDADADTRPTTPLHTPLVARLVAHFSGYARLCVAGLVITGAYAGWLQVGSVAALTNTTYGQTLLIKLALFAPLLILAAINLLITQRRLRAGRDIWVGRLRGLVGAEVALLAGILVAVGVMTAITPARTASAGQAAAPPADQHPAPVNEFYMTEDHLHIAFDVLPGWVGTNIFTITLSNEAGEWITDASLVRLRFEHQAENLGRSELRLQHVSGGTYTARGANLSVPGAWRIRLNVQRPGAYDAVVDFRPTIRALPVSQDAVPLVADRLVALSAAGVVALIVGGFSLMRVSLWPLRGEALLALGLIALGLVMLASLAGLTG
jgi:copper transport protein